MDKYNCSERLGNIQSSNRCKDDGAIRSYRSNSETDEKKEMNNELMLLMALIGLYLIVLMEE